MREEIFSNRAIRHLAVAIVLAAFLIPPSPSPAAAAVLGLDPYSYFDVDYSITFSDNEVQGNEVFYLVVEGRVTCIKDLPFGVDRAEATGSIIAQHKETGATEVLNTAYSVTISPFPDWKGETYELEQRVGLVFPSGSRSGKYNVIAQLVQAKIDGWDVTELIPESYKSVSVGTITYAASPQDYPSFVVSNLSISPSRAEAGQAVTISVEVRNNGSTAGSYTLNLLINGVLQDSREITLAPEESKIITYQVGESEEGDYHVTLDGQSGKFTIGPAFPPTPPLLSWLSRHWLLIAIVIFLLLLL